MPKKHRKHKRRSPPRSRPAPQPSTKRRLPAPHIPGHSRSTKAKPQTHPHLEDSQNPYVSEIVAHLDHVSAASGLPKLTLLSDWLGMMEASLRMWAQNMTAMATTGRFVDDPPDIAALFARARARYLQAATRYPAAYRKMQQSFSLTFALLMESAAPGLAHYAGQPDLSPDVIGQVFMTCLEPGPAWAQFFPPWAMALEQAQTALPDGSALVYQRLVEAALRARLAGETIVLEPGENFVEWFEAVQPYFEPLIIGPSLIDSSVMMLAAATRFQPWMVDLKLVEFYWTADIDPLLVRMARLNAMLYNLNGYLLEHVQAGARITAYLEAHDIAPDVDLALPDLSAGLNTNPPPTDTNPTPSPSPPESPPGPSFADLFRQPNDYHDKEHPDDE